MSEKSTYTAFLVADAKVTPSFHGASKGLEKYCALNNIKIIDLNPIGGEAELSMTEEEAAQLAQRADLLENLPVPGGVRGLVKGTARLQADDYTSPGLTA